MRLDHPAFRRLALVAAATVFIAACAAQPEPKPAPPPPAATAPPPADPARIAMARRLMVSIGVGDIAMKALNDDLAARAKGSPGMLELFQRVMSGMTAETFNDLAAGIYAQHLSYDHLLTLTQFTESRTGSRFFKAFVDAKARETPQNEVFAQFSADELTEIMKFAQDDAALALRRELPEINRRMGEESEKLGRDMVQQYLERN